LCHLFFYSILEEKSDANVERDGFDALTVRPFRLNPEPGPCRAGLSLGLALNIMIFRLHKHTKGSFAPSDTDSCRQPDLKGAFPRSLQAPLSMGSPLSADQFTLWPPTPRHGEPPHDGAQTYSFSTTEERSADNSMVSTWDPSQLDLTLSYCPMPGTGIDIPQVEGGFHGRQ